MKPDSAADRRPDDIPYYANSTCETCGTDLIYYHEAYPEKYDSEDEYFYDEFWCVECEDGILLDWPAEHKNQMFKEFEKAVEDIKNGNFITLEELKDRID